MSATGPNRTYLWGGTINASKEHGPFIAYSGGDEMGRFLPWESYGETLQKAGLSWHVYQCARRLRRQRHGVLRRLRRFRSRSRAVRRLRATPSTITVSPTSPPISARQMTNADDLAQRDPHRRAQWHAAQG